MRLLAQHRRFELGFLLYQAAWEVEFVGSDLFGHLGFSVDEG